jgi:deazaflavin-dependent oxidoreductase (nitroreductase family)
MWTGTTLILIHHIGAKSGIERVIPVALLPQGEGRFAIWAANGGSPTHPNWYCNVKAHPRITVEVGTHTFTVLVEELDATARAELWPKLVAEWPKPAAGSPDLGAAQAQDHAAVSGIHADPPGLTRDENPACAIWYRCCWSTSPPAPGSPAAERSSGRHGPRAPQFPRPARHSGTPRRRG